MDISASLKDNKKLVRLWDGYAQAGYEKMYSVHISGEHQRTFGGLFLTSNNGICLDGGCGTGNMFELIVQRINPAELCALDWSEDMLNKAKLEAERLQQISGIEFKLSLGDISELLPWPDGFFDSVVSNLIICYLTVGWQKPLEELNRVIKPGGYLYLGTLLDNWGFAKVLWKHAPQEFFRRPVESLKGLKYRRIVSGISKELKKRGAEFPSQKNLIDFLESLGFREIEATPTYWGGGVALRAQKPLS